MREILFRGKRIDGGGWVEGDLTRRKSRFAPQLNTTYGISDAFGVFCAVDPETVGQYTGLTDKNGEKIFEGDIVVCAKYIGGNFVDYCIERGFVEMRHSAFGLHRKQGFYRPFKDWLEDYEYEVIGNCYGNPELLEVES